MRQLLKKTMKWDWTTDRKSDFNKKARANNTAFLSTFQQKQSNYRYTDACKTGLG